MKLVMGASVLYAERLRVRANEKAGRGCGSGSRWEVKMRMRADFRCVFRQGVAINIRNLTVDSLVVPDQVVCQHEGVSLAQSTYFGILTSGVEKELMCPAEAGGTGGVFRGETGGGA